MKLTMMTLCASALLLLAVPAQAAGDPRAGQLKTSMCAGSHPSMTAIAGSLSERDMDDLAAYYASSYSGAAN
ncbi:MAG: hypothetical protein B7Y33_06030 [Hydrogenophilales bacterium 16-62-9]|nr:MAG: hypothetical protein B7Y33_06030 [Hydrogenophilales bacterium 16-62-9]